MTAAFFRHLPKATIAITLTIGLAGCGASQKTVDTTTVMTVLRKAGFAHLALLRSTNNPTKTNQGLAGADWIYTPGYNPVEMPLSAVRFASVAAARKRFANDEPLLKGTVPPGERNVVSPGFDASRLTEVRICNVVLSSYNAHRTRNLTRRFRYAVTQLRTKC